MITRLLVANRGEIARRVFATCRRLGIETVAVHSDADAGMPFVADADFAVRLPGPSAGLRTSNAPAETYLRGDLVIEAARRAGADAIHPGYGFLSENADFAREVESAGLTWVGPTPESIDAMGSKIEAKRIMSRAGVPVLEAPPAPTEADLPLLVKASAGGGGRGMRVVRELDRLQPEIEAARAEAQSAFGDGTVFVEPYVERGRHVEVQLVGDGRGDVAVFGERDCSLQRRHQKVVEEAPAPSLPDHVRSALHEAARKAGEAIDYRGAGTVEFLYDAESERFWFLEMNTRLQVEHPVSECVHGVDLVEAQLAVAEGRGLPEAAGSGEARGHAVEVRLYAEDPHADYQPQSGRLTTFELPGDVAFDELGRAGIRVDSGFTTGDEVSTHYDAMLAKVISWAPTREHAIRQLVGALGRARIHGLTTNRDQLLAILRDERFVAGDVSTAMLADGALTGGDRPTGDAAPAAAVAIARDAGARRTVQQGTPVAWRNVVSQPQRTTLVVGEDETVVEWYGGRTITFADEGLACLGATATDRGWRVTLERDGVATTYDVTLGDGLPGTRSVHVDGGGVATSYAEVPRFVDPSAQVASGSLLAPMPGTVVKVVAEVGQAVEAGDPVLVLEAMKMQHTVSAPTAGTVTEINVDSGAQVAAGEVLAVVSEEEQG